MARKTQRTAIQLLYLYCPVHDSLFCEDGRWRTEFHDKTNVAYQFIEQLVVRVNSDHRSAMGSS